MQNVLAKCADRIALTHCVQSGLSHSVEPLRSLGEEMGASQLLPQRIDTISFDGDPELQGTDSPSLPEVPWTSRAQALNSHF